MSNITICKMNTSIESIRQLLKAFKFETVDTDGDIEFIASDFGFTWIRDDGDSIRYPMAGDVVHYWTTLAEAMSHSNENNYADSQQAENEIAYRQEMMG